jgi:putative transposase
LASYSERIFVQDEGGQIDCFGFYFNVTEHPTGPWIVQQLREAFSESNPCQYIIFDRDAKFETEVTELLKATGIKPKRTADSSPWQNGIAELWIGSCRRELLDHVIVLNESHLRRLVRKDNFPDTRIS